MAPRWVAMAASASTSMRKSSRALERHGAQHPHRILEKALVRIADAAQHTGLQILQSADVVDDGKRPDVVEERVDGEVTTECVFLGRAEGVFVFVAIVPVGCGTAMIGLAAPRGRSDCRWSRQQRIHRRVRRCPGPHRGFGIAGVQWRLELGSGRELAAERGDFDDLGSELDVRQTEAASDNPAVAKEALDLRRVRRGADVEVLRPSPEQQVADAAADQIGGVSALVETIEDFESVWVDGAAGDRVFGARNDDRLHH